MRFVFILCSLLLFSQTSAASMDSVRTEKRPEGLFVIHEVEEEETLYSLARRYGAEVNQIILHNSIESNLIEIGQLIEIKIEERKVPEVDQDGEPRESQEKTESYHIVNESETLYGISKSYGLKIKDLQKWNDLKDNYLSPGMKLRLVNQLTGSPKAGKTVKMVTKKQTEQSQSDSSKISTGIEKIKPSFDGFQNYLVQTGETIYSIAEKINVNLDSLRKWNGLQTDYLRIGQELFFKKVTLITKGNVSSVTANKDVRSHLNEDGFERIYENGVASLIESMNTTKFLALHRHLPIGTKLEVRNIMNNQVVLVKVVGRLPDTGINKSVMIRLSKPAYDRLGILDVRSRVEVSYFK